MGRISDLPEDVTKLIPCRSVTLREEKGIYRVYRYSAVKLDSGNWASGKQQLIGKIIPGVAFVPNRRYLKELGEAEKPHYSDEVTDLAYGQYALLASLSKDVYSLLNAHFTPERAAQIYCYGIILSANGFVHMDQADEFYSSSILSLEFSRFSFRMGYRALGSLLSDLGKKGNAVAAFEQSLIDGSSKNIAIDGHVIRSMSENNGLSEAGYKMGQLKSEQVNLLIAYDTKRNSPVMYRTYRGSSVDKSSVLSFIRSRSFTGTKFVVDRGFFSKGVLDLMSENGNTYVIPLPSSDRDFKRIRKSLAYDGGEFIYHAGKKETARVIYHEERLRDGSRVIVYKDTDENNSSRKSYRMHMAEGDSGYTEEGYAEACEWWGVMFLRTNTEETPSEVYCDYKDRWSIETYNNYVKNDAGFTALKIQDYYAQKGFDFVMLIAGLIHSRLSAAVLSLGNASISTYDVLIKAGRMRMVKEKGEWKLHNARNRDVELFRKMGYTPSDVYAPILASAKE